MSPHLEPRGRSVVLGVLVGVYSRGDVGQDWLECMQSQAHPACISSYDMYQFDLLLGFAAGVGVWAHPVVICVLSATSTFVEPVSAVLHTPPGPLLHEEPDPDVSGAERGAGAAAPGPQDQ